MPVCLIVDITPELNARLDLLAEQSGTTKSGLLRKAFALIDLAVSQCGQGHKIVITDNKLSVIREIVGVCSPNRVDSPRSNH